MNWWAIFAAGLLAGATTCAATQGGLLVGLLARQKKAAEPGAADRRVATAAAPTAARSSSGERVTPAATKRQTPKAKAMATSAPAARAPLADDVVPVAGFLLGKLLVLSLVGAVLGGIGSMVTLDSRVGGVAQLLAAAVMIVLGLSTMGVPGFESFVFAPPESWTRVVRRSTRSQSAFAPFLLGLATVLIPCGVTISMMLLAATSGSAYAGAAVMAVFVVGTAPLFAAYGFLTHRFVRTDSRAVSLALGAVVVVMGLVAFNSFLVSTGAPVSGQKLVAAVLGSQAVAAPAAPAPAPTTVDGVQVLRIDATSSGYSPESISARAGVPTKLVLHTDNTRSCIVYTVFPTLGKQVALPDTGDTEVDLGTLQPGDVPISCSMGMYTGTIVVS